MAEFDKLPKALVFNALAGVLYYEFCSGYSLLSKDTLKNQMFMYGLSSVIYNPLEEKWGNRDLCAMDIVPFTLLLLAKDNASTWKTIGVTTTLLGGAQTATAKALNDPLPPPPPHPHVTKWLYTEDVEDYGIEICEPKAAVFSMAFMLGHADAITKTVDRFGSTCPLQFYPLLMSNNHWTLCVVNFDKRTVEYYDSKMNYGNHKQVCTKLETLTAHLTTQFPGEKDFTFECKIKKSLQPDGYQCGVWILYFTEKLLENPDTDFNELDVEKAQTMIADLRMKLIPHFVTKPWTETN